MGIAISRFYKQEKLTFDCEIITPMFLGNASQEAELRAAPFKGLLRYWWRVAEGHRFKAGEHKKMLKEENRIFGSPDEEGGGKSRVTVEVESVTGLIPQKNAFSSPGKVDHPECEKSKYKTELLNYLAGMGLIHFRKGIQHSYFNNGEIFKLSVTASHDVMTELNNALKIMGLFASIGSRSRNGWGCFHLDENGPKVSCSTISFTEAMDRDYPHCLGHDSHGLLFWGTKQTFDKWEKCMKSLADIYISVRAGSRAKNIPAINVKSGSIPDRHALGYPVTNHSVSKTNWKNTGRHGSALRLLVKKLNNGYHGYFLHLPHLFSKDMWPDGKNQQIKVWRQVHKSLDSMCLRANLQEGR